MKHVIIVVVALCALLAMGGPATQGQVHQFVGLWEAVDSGDGGHQVLSITDNGDGTVKLLVYDTFFSLCDGSRGIGQGTGVSLPGRSLQSDDFTVICFETNQTQTTPTTFRLDPDGTLFRVRASLAPIIYHRSSK
jgi:hypothetical protein